MAEAKSIVLLTVEPLSPYRANEVFSVGEAEAKLLLETKRVVKYDPKNAEHVKALEKQRGKAADAE